MTVNSSNISVAAEIIRNGGLVIFPTETVYGLGANALDPKAVKKIYKVKGRPSKNPIIVHIADEADLNKLSVNVPIIAKPLIANFWPGPLTIILEKSKLVPSEVTSDLNTVAVRMPSHPGALKLIRESGVPIAAPSANTSGKPSPTTFRHALADLGSKVDLVLDGGDCNYGLESTVIDLTTTPPTILRPGFVTKDQIESFIGPVTELLGKTTSQPKSPGIAFRHYAPDAELKIYYQDNFVDEIIKDAKEYIKKKKRVGILTTNENRYRYPKNCIVFSMGYRASLSSVAHNIYSTLLEMDSNKVDIILCESFPPIGIGQAIMNRLEKATAKKVILSNSAKI